MSDVFLEPSFGIGRVMYAIFEHNFKVREGKAIPSDFFLFSNQKDNLALALVQVLNIISSNFNYQNCVDMTLMLYLLTGDEQRTYFSLPPLIAPLKE